MQYKTPLDYNIFGTLSNSHIRYIHCNLKLLFKKKRTLQNTYYINIAINDYESK